MAWLMERKKVGAWHMSAQQVWWVLSGCQTCQALGGTFKGGEVPLEVVVNQGGCLETHWAHLLFPASLAPWPHGPSEATRLEKRPTVQRPQDAPSLSAALEGPGCTRQGTGLGTRDCPAPCCLWSQVAGGDSLGDSVSRQGHGSPGQARVLLIMTQSSGRRHHIELPAWASRHGPISYFHTATHSASSGVFSNGSW